MHAGLFISYRPLVVINIYNFIYILFYLPIHPRPVQTSSRPFFPRVLWDRMRLWTPVATYQKRHFRIHEFGTADFVGGPNLMSMSNYVHLGQII